ncbi:MAG TPA: DUF3298 and DUF4163 domain-containing protein [Candidatus Avimonas sp.]|nr:DUF3298 and DUF4163 domain-containing protein [Candidatus Avimonas sp.]
MNQNNSAVISIRETTREFTYDRTTMLNLKIQRPVVQLYFNKSAQNRINQHYFAKANSFYRTAYSELYPQAVKLYRESKESGFPFHAFEAIMQFEITFNERCHLSSYSDSYQYTGGAHGTTLRSSETFSLKTGKKLALSDLFPKDFNYRGFLLGQIITQADEIMEKEQIFFDDYRELIVQNFNPSSFYLSPEGLVIYYQQYDIAPYASGIIEFTIPYSVLGSMPEC